MKPEDTIRMLAKDNAEVNDILKKYVLYWGVGGRFLLTDASIYPKWFRGQQISHLFQITSYLDGFTSKETGFWLRVFMRYLMLHAGEIHSFQSNLRDFSKEYGHCWDCIEQEFQEILNV